VLLKLESLIPAIAVGIGLGTVLFYINSPMGQELFHSFATRHKKRGHGGYGGGHGYKGDRGFYTKHGHHHCHIGEPGCVCTDPSKCRVGSTGRGGGGGGHHGGEYGGGRRTHSKQHHITGTPVHQRHHSSSFNNDEFDPSDFDFEHVFESPHGRESLRDGNLSI
jgi:hypothetical protein